MHWPDNHSPQGKFTSCVLHAFPAAQWWGSLHQGTAPSEPDSSMALNKDPAGWVRRASGFTRGPEAKALLSASDNLPVAAPFGTPDGLPAGFADAAAACAAWSGADVRERLGLNASTPAGAAPPWIADRVRWHARQRQLRTDICAPGHDWCGE